MSNKKFSFHKNNPKEHEDPWEGVEVGETVSDTTIFNESEEELEKQPIVVENKENVEINEEKPSTLEDNKARLKSGLLSGISQIKEIGKKAQEMGNQVIGATEAKLMNNSPKEEMLNQQNEEIEELKNTVNSLRKEMDYLKKEQKTVNSSSGITLKDDIQIQEVAQILCESKTFILNLGKHLHEEITIQIKDYLEEQLRSVLDKIKDIKLEELNLELGFNEKIVNFDSLIDDKKEILNKVISDMNKSQIELHDISEKLSNEQALLKNIIEETETKGNALRSLREEIHHSKININKDLGEYKKEQLKVIDQEIQLETQKKMEAFQQKCDDAIAKIKLIFQETMIEMTPEMEEKIRNDMRNKESNNII